MVSRDKAGVRLFETLRRNAFSRLVVMAACLLVWLIGFRGFAMPALKALGAPGSVPGDTARVAGALIYAAGALLLYRTLVGKIEHRSPVELACRPGFALGFLGFAIGVALSFAAIGLMWLAAAGQATGFGDASRLIATFTGAIMASVGEELLFRGVLFRILEQAFGTVAALLASALFFGLAHIVNPDSTIVGALAIAVEAGLLLGLAYVVTRSLWFPVGLHLAWNFSQGGVFGSGSQPGLVRLAFTGPDWLTGGRSGAEASVLTVALCLGLAIAFAVLASRRGEWKRAKLKLTLE